MRILYILVSGYQDLFYEQFIISATSARLVMPKVQIEVLTDDISLKSFCGKRAKIFEISNKVHSKILPQNMEAKERSRWLKTSMRNIVDGDFLYIDCDTIICKKLDEFKLAEYDIGAVLDGHELIGTNYYSKDYEMRAKICGFHAGYNNTHYNGGVIWCKDNARTRDFFKLWHKLWRETCKKKWIIDQISLNEANWRYNGIITEISGIWNCQLEYGMKFFHDALILHYLNFNGSNSKSFYKLANKDVLIKIRDNDSIPDTIMQIINNPKSEQSFYQARIIPINIDEHSSYRSSIIVIADFLFRRFHFISVFGVKVIMSIKNIWRYYFIRFISNNKT